MITTIKEFKFILENNKDESFSIRFYNKDKNHQIDTKIFTGPDAYNDAIVWGRNNLDNFNSDMISYTDTQTNEGFFDFLKRNKKPMNTPDPIPNDAKWWTKNDVFVFGSNTEGRHDGGAAKAAMNNYSAIYGQARGLQGQSYGIVTLDYTESEPVNINTISDELDDLIYFANNNKSLTFWMTKIGTGISRIPFNEIRELFLTKTFPNNIKLPIEFE